MVKPNHLKIHGKSVKVDSTVPITWKPFGDTFIEYGLVEEKGDGSEYEAKVVEDDFSEHVTILFQKAATSTSTNGAAEQSVNNSSYVDEFARFTMLPLAAAAYNDQPEICLNNTLLMLLINITCDVYGKDDICAGYTAVSHPDNAIVVSFRGTNAFSQLLVETSQTASKEKVDSRIGGKVGYYFADVFNKLWFNNTLHFWSTKNRDGDYANALDAHLLTENTYRITHSRDPVVHMPPHKYYNYTHNKAEVWYSNDMTINKTYTVCTHQQESQNCSAQISYVFYINDHLNYFNKQVSDYGKAGCVTEERR
uniref:Uncharacterized protein n=1 Tax=Ditylenchus dipsaci TaxID=166011 RepID=A0A915DDH7_9BILA